MNDITNELSMLHVLTGADFSRQVERIAKMDVFYPLAGETGILLLEENSMMISKISLMRLVKQ